MATLAQPTTSAAAQAVQAVAGPSTTMLKRMGGPSDLKAGLSFRDPQEVQKIIYEASKGEQSIRRREVTSTC